MLKIIRFSTILLVVSCNTFADLRTDAVDALVNKNYITAVPLLKDLANQGDPNAQYNLAMLYKRGLGVSANASISRNYLSSSARKGLVDSYRSLSVSSIKPYSVQTTFKIDAALDPQIWVKTQNENYYTLQLASSTNAKLIQKYFLDNGLAGKAGYYKNRREGEDWYALVYGAYPSVNTASQAIASLPKDLRKWSPWVRKLKSIQRVMIE